MHVLPEHTPAIPHTSCPWLNIRHAEMRPVSLQVTGPACTGYMQPMAYNYYAIILPTVDIIYLSVLVGNISRQRRVRSENKDICWCNSDLAAGVLRHLKATMRFESTNHAGWCAALERT